MTTAVQGLEGTRRHRESWAVGDTGDVGIVGCVDGHGIARGEPVSAEIGTIEESVTIRAELRDKGVVAPPPNVVWKAPGVVGNPPCVLPETTMPPALSSAMPFPLSKPEPPR